MAKKSRNRQHIDVDPTIQKRIRELAEGLLEVDNETSSFWSRIKPGKGIRYKDLDIDDLIDKLDKK
jgi:hypothetical protein